MRARANRTIEHLHLRAESEAALRRFLPRLEDAFRTAEIADGPGRLLIVRRWNLGQLPANASPQTLSLMIESRFAAAGWQVAHGAAAGAEAAHAVWFRDALEAHEVAAARLVAGRSLDAWFWPIALPALAPGSPGNERMRVLAFSVAALDEAPVALPHWLDAVVSAGGLSHLIEALRPGDGRALLRAAHRSPAAASHPVAHHMMEPAAADGATRTAATDTADVPVRPPVGHRTRRGDPIEQDDRLEMLERLVSVSRRSLIRAGVLQTRPFAPGRDLSQAARRATDPGRPAAGDTAAQASVARPDGSSITSKRSPATRVGDRGDEETASSGITSLPGAAVQPGANLPAEALRPRPRSRDRSPERSTATAPSASNEPDVAGTAAGGLLFLVPLLDRLAFGTWCLQAERAGVVQPAALAGRLFEQLLTRLAIADEDAAWSFARSLAPEAVATDDPSAAVDASVSHWLRACRVSLRRQAGIGPATLVRRPAGLAWSPTHVDVFFSLAAADIRIRRNGLDIDPGWVPWLGRVVTFHYGQGSWR